MEVLKNKRLLAAIGLISLFLGTILPYYKFSAFGFSESVSLWGYLEGKIILILILANTLFIFKDLIEKYAPQLFKSNLGQKIANVTNPKLSLIPLVLIIIFIIFLNSKMASYVHLDKGLGFYLSWFGIIIMAAHSFIYKGNAINMPLQSNNINNSNNLSNQINQFQQVNPTNSLATAQNNIKYCPKCGTANDINTSNCTNCMFKF